MSQSLRIARRTETSNHRTLVQRGLIALAALVILFDMGVIAFLVYSIFDSTLLERLLQSPDLGGLATMFVLRIGLPLALVIGLGTLLQHRLHPEPDRIAQPLTIPRLVGLIAVLTALPVAGLVGYTLLNNTFINLFLSFRDVATVGYLFLIRIVVPLILLLGIGTWLRRKLDPDAGEQPPARSRYAWLERLPKLPHLSNGGILFVTFVGALWAAFIGVTLARFMFGLSYTTNMSDDYPWGLWLGFDMIGGVALAAGGFVMAGTVHIFGVKRFHPIVRPAILTAFIGYLLAIAGLLFDLGRWYNVWHAVYLWNWRSPLIEVAWCVMLYSTVLAIEFSPIVFERFRWRRALRVVKIIMLPVIIAGLVLSTLHQSTLGTLFLIFPEKMNPLWYSALLPVLFLLSAIGVGLAMTIVESNLSARFLGQGLESDLLASLGKAASVVLSIYLLLRLGDLVSRGDLAYAFIPGLHAVLFWVEILVGFALPLLILARKANRENARRLFLAAGLMVGGVVLNRLDTTILSWWRFTSGGPMYVPTLQEVIGTLSLISIGVVAFGVIAKNFPVFEKPRHSGVPAE